MLKKLVLVFAFAVGVALVATPDGVSGAAAQKQKKAPPKKEEKKDEKAAATIDKTKLVGTWVMPEDTVLGDKGATYEFTKDGKLKLAPPPKKKGGGEGTYKLDGDKLTWKVTIAGVTAEPPPFKVAKVTDKQLVLEGVDGKPITLDKK